MATKGYNVEFDISLKSGNKKEKSESQFIVVSTLPYNITANAAYAGTDYLFSLSMGQFDEDGYKTTWYINDLANSTGTTKTLENTKWYHVKLVVTASSVTYTITDNSTSSVLHSGSKTVTSMPTMKGFYSLNAYGGAFMKFDNFEIYDFSTLPSMTKSWGQDYRIISKTQLNMAAASGDASCTNAISAGESYYWVPSLNGTSAATNANVGFYCKNSNGRQWRIANTSSKKCYQGIANVSSSSTVHIYNLKKGQIVKVGGFDDDTSALYAGAGVLTALTDYDNGDIRFYEVNADGTGELTISSTWAYVYFVEVFEPNNEIVGPMVKSAAWDTYKSSDITLKDGESYRVAFNNHGSGNQTYENFYVFISNGGATPVKMRADWWDNATDGEGVAARFTNRFKHSTNGGTTTSTAEPDWTKFKSDMKDAEVEFVLSYINGTASFTGTATKGDDVYYYEFSYGSGSLTGDVTYNLSVEKAWLEILSVDLSATPVSTLADRNYASYVTSEKLDFGNTDGITAYIATGFNAGKSAIVLTPVDVVPANTPIIVKTDTKGATVNVSITTADASDVSGNALVAGDGTTAWNGTDGYTYYYLASDLFHKATEGTLQSGKAYLKIANGDVPSTARDFSFVFDDSETTGIDASLVNSEKSIVNSVFDLQGRKVANPTRGLYIVNGKKVIVK